MRGACSRPERWRPFSASTRKPSPGGPRMGGSAVSDAPGRACGRGELLEQTLLDAAMPAGCVPRDVAVITDRSKCGAAFVTARMELGAVPGLHEPADGRPLRSAQRGGRG